MTKQLSALRLPDFFTLIGMASAIISIFCSMHEFFLFAYLLLLAQFVFDGIDGKIARKYGKGKLGLYLDSFSDFMAIVGVVFFGWFIGIHTPFFYIGAVLFIFSAAIRLSFFTVRAHENKQDFIGIPTVTSVVIIASILFGNNQLSIVDMNWLVCLYYLFSYGMISNLKMKKFQ